MDVDGVGVEVVGESRVPFVLVTPFTCFRDLGAIETSVLVVKRTAVDVLGVTETISKEIRVGCERNEIDVPTLNLTRVLPSTHTLISCPITAQRTCDIRLSST